MAGFCIFFGEFFFFWGGGVCLGGFLYQCVVKIPCFSFIITKIVRFYFYCLITDSHPDYQERLGSIMTLLSSFQGTTGMEFGGGRSGSRLEVPHSQIRFQCGAANIPGAE